MLDGSKKSPVPIMLPATSIVACTSDIFLPGSPTGASRRTLLQALDVVDAVPVLDAVRIMPEPGELLVPGGERLQVAQIGTIGRAGRLAGHEHRDAGRIGDDARGEDAIGQLVE